MITLERIIFIYLIYIKKQTVNIILIHIILSIIVCTPFKTNAWIEGGEFIILLQSKENKTISMD